MESDVAEFLGGASGVVSTNGTEPPWPEWVVDFRQPQLDAVSQIMDAYARGVEIVILEAPTGAGKTLIGEMVRRELKTRGVYTCTTKTLQDQVLGDFPYARVLKGRRNYPTEFEPNYTAEDCGGKNKCRWCSDWESCAYQNAKEEARLARLSVLNTAYMLAEFNAGKSAFSGADFAIIDEACVLESVMMGNIQFRLTTRRARELGVKLPVKSARVKTVRTWLFEELRPVLLDRMKELRGDDVEVIRARGKLSRMLSTCDRAYNSMTDEEWGDWVREYEDDNEDFILKPVRVSSQGAGMVWRHAKKWLLMDGFIGSVDELVSSLGIEESGKSWEYVQIPYSWPIENRPLHYLAAANMTYANMSEEVPKAIASIETILDNHPSMNILVHTVSYGLTKWIQRELRDSDALHGRVLRTYMNAGDREKTLSDFKRHGGVVLAPSFERGVDLPEEQCQAIVVAKMPYPNLKDRQVSERLRGEDGQLWYAVQVARNLVQMLGRGARSETDTCELFVVDTNFGRFWGDWGGRLFPSWMQEALV